MNLNEKTMKKVLKIMAIVIIVLIVALIAFLFTTGRIGNQKDEQITLEYWGLWEPETVMQPIIQKYQTENPNVTIKYTQRRFSDYENQLHTRLEQGATEGSPVPDIVKINNTWLTRYQKFLTPIPESIMGRNEYSSTFYPMCLNDFTGTDGQIYAMPIGVDGLALYYNKEFVTAPPEDWDSVVEIAKKITRRDSDGKIIRAGIAIGSTKNITHSADIISALLLQNNVDIISNNKINLTSQNAQDAFKFFTDFETEHKVWSSDLHSDLDMFFRGELGMLLAPSWRAFDIIEAAPHIEFGISYLPQLAANDPVDYAMYWGEAVSKTTAHPEEAWKFLKFLTQEENLKLLQAESRKIRAFGQPYPLVSLQTELAQDKYAFSIIEMASTMKSFPMAQHPFVEDNIRKAIANPKDAEEQINLFFDGF